ncbi:MAG: hypothetical protein Q9204_001067 [Flavoplaca sp. TL-2023a]
MSPGHQDSRFSELSKPDDLSETYSQTGSELSQRDDDGGNCLDDYEIQSPEEESADEKFRKIRQTLHQKIAEDRSVKDEVWNTGSKDEEYKVLLDECLKLETGGRHLEKLDEWDALSCLQFVIKKIYRLRAAHNDLNLTMANKLVGLIIELVSQMGSCHLLYLLRVSSDTKPVSAATYNGAAPSTLIAHDKEQGNNWDEEYSPLFMAIQFDVDTANKSRSLTVFMCENLPESDRRKALAAKNKNNESWLHAALLADLEGVEKMIKWAPVSVFQEPRRANGLEDGNTPLHDALDYRKHIAPFPLCAGTHQQFEKQPAEFAPELNKAVSAQLPKNTPCTSCVAAAKHFQNSWVRRDCIVKELLNQDIRALRKQNTSGRPPYLYYTHTRAICTEQLPKKIDATSLCGQSPAANTDSAGNRAKGKTSNPKSTDDVNPAKKDNEPDKKNIPDRSKTSHNSKRLEDSKKSDNNKDSNEIKRSGDNKKSDDNTRFDDNKKLDDLKKPKEIKTSEKELNTGNEPSSSKKQPENIKASDQSKTPESNKKASLKSPIQPGKRAVHFPDPEYNAMVPGDQNKEGPGLEPKLVRSMSQVSRVENRVPNTSVKKSSGRATKSNRPLHRQMDLPKKELTVGLEALLKEKAYVVGGYEEACECLFRKQKDGQDMGSDEEHRLQSWRLDTKEARISMNTKRDFDFFSFASMMSSVIIDLRDAESEEDLKRLTPEGKIDRWTRMQGDLMDVFKWLKDKKKVKGIMRLVVRDRGPIFCSDETVENCLDGLEVRYLDWDRPDMCIDTLLLTPDLIQVDLHWSGLKAVLSSWGNTNGLRKLQRLRDVNLHALKGREEKERMKKYVGKFIAEARDWQRPEGDPKLPNIHAKYPDASTDGENKNVNLKTGTPQNDNHPWFIKATEFAGRLRVIRWPDLERLKVKVAVIDDGVSPTYEGVSQNLHHPGWPYNGEKAQENFTSTYGHGSKMAYLITRMCPFVEIYVAKLDANTTTFRERTFSLGAAKKAVEWATSRGVDVISMSWNVQRTGKTGNDPGNEDEVAELEKAINLAAKEKNILMYCAAGDQKGGISSSTKWVPCDSENTISIGATDINGNKKGYVVDNKKLAYLFPGENILKEMDRDSRDVGNSGATALAAGLAAMVLFFSRAKDINIEKKSVKEYMERVFEKVFNATGKVVQVASVLGEEKSKLETFEEKLKGVQRP